MKKIAVILDTEAKSIFSYRLCGQQLIVNKPVYALAAFSQRIQNGDTLSSAQEPAKDGPTKVIFNGESWLAGKTRKISCLTSSDGYVVDIPDTACFQVNSDGSCIRLLMDTARMPSAQSETQLEQLLLGPPLMLALALNNQFALHASAVMIDQKAVLFVGDSGFGKSTIAKWLSEDAKINRLTDDISVIIDQHGDYLLESGFPQLKLEENQQNPHLPPTQITAVVLLHREQECTPQLSKLQTIESVAVLVNHSVASQLFDKQLAESHLSFMATLSSKVPIYRLDYPSGKENINKLTAILKQELN